MAKNPGKCFENDFKVSVPDDAYYLRLNDAGGWSNAENTRFTPSNVCDCIIYDRFNMFMIEFKSHRGKSIPFSCIREKQLQGLAKAREKGVIAGFIINFRDLAETYFIYVEDVHFIMSKEERKSIPIDYVRTVGIKVGQEKKRTRCRYDVKSMLVDVI